MMSDSAEAGFTFDSQPCDTAEGSGMVEGEGGAVERCLMTHNLTAYSIPINKIPADAAGEDGADAGIKRVVMWLQVGNLDLGLVGNSRCQALATTRFTPTRRAKL